MRNRFLYEPTSLTLLLLKTKANEVGFPGHLIEIEERRATWHLIGYSKYEPDEMVALSKTLMSQKC